MSVNTSKSSTANIVDITRMVNNEQRKFVTFKPGLILLILFLSACSTQQPTVKPETSAETIQKIPEMAQQPADQPIEIIDDRLFVEGVTAMQQTDLITAQSLFRKFIDNYPSFSGAYLNLALIQYQQENYAESLELTNKTLSLNPSQAQAYQLRAQLYIQTGKINKAKDDYLKAIQLDPEYINAQYNLALLYDIYLQEIALAIKHYEIYMSLVDKPDETTQDWINHLKGSLKNDLG